MSPTLSTFFIAVLGSTLAATIVGFFLSWWKESRQKQLEAEDFLDACVKWEIAQGGQSHRATQERMDKLSVAVANFQKELLS